MIGSMYTDKGEYPQRPPPKLLEGLCRKWGRIGRKNTGMIILLPKNAKSGTAMLELHTVLRGGSAYEHERN